MNLRSYHLIVGSVLFIVLMAACALSGSGGVSIASPTSNATAPTQQVSAPASIAATPVSVAPTQSQNAPAGGACANAYYPVLAGASHSYSSTGSAVGDYTYIVAISTVGDTGFTTSYQYSTGGNATVKWTCQAGNLAALDAGNSSLSFTTLKIKMDSNSVTADGYNIPASFDSGKTWSEKVTVKGTAEVTNGKTVDGQISSQFACSSAGTDSITVPAGKFDTVKATCDKTVIVSALEQGKLTRVGANHEYITYWYANGVGFVKSVATGGANNETVVLTQYKLK